MRSINTKNGLTKRLLVFLLCALIVIVNICSVVYANTEVKKDFPEYAIGNNRDVIFLDGEWQWTVYEADEDSDALSDALPTELQFNNTLNIPSYTAYSSDILSKDKCYIVYKKSFYLTNAPRESVVIDFGVDGGADAVYVNNLKCNSLSIAKFLSEGKNDIVLFKEYSADETNKFHFVDQISLVISNAPVITSANLTTDLNEGTLSVEVNLYNSRDEAITTDVTVEIFDNDNHKVGNFVLEDVTINNCSNTSATVTGIKIDKFSDTQKWQSNKPYVFGAKITVNGDSIDVPFAMIPDDLFGGENNKFGMDLIVSEFFTNANNKGLTWDKKWVESLFKYFKEINWTVITYRDGYLPEIWHDISLKEGILIVDKNNDADWKSAQDSLWINGQDFVVKSNELKNDKNQKVIIPVVYNAIDGLFNSQPELTGFSKTRLKNTFNNSYVAATNGSDSDNKGFFEDFKYRFHRNFIQDNRYNLFLDGLKNTLLVTAAATLFGVFIGIIIAVIKVVHAQNVISKKKNLFIKVLNFVAETYTAIIRGTPVVVQLLITYNIIFRYSDEAVMVGIFAFSINSGAYISEIIRAGINSVDRGQTEAGRSLGLSQFTTMKSIVLPQALKNILPALGNEFIALLKETSVIGYLGVIDLTRAGDIVISRTADSFFVLIFVALVYFILVFGLSTLIKVFERRLNRSDKN